MEIDNIKGDECYRESDNMIKMCKQCEKRGKIYTFHFCRECAINRGLMLTKQAQKSFEKSKNEMKKQMMKDLKLT